MGHMPSNSQNFDRWGQGPHKGLTLEVGAGGSGDEDTRCLGWCPGTGFCKDFEVIEYAYIDTVF